MTRRRILMLGVAGLLSASALLAIGILLLGRFGGVQGRILGSTALLGAYGLVALPAAFLLDQGRARVAARTGIALAAAGAALALALVWSGSRPEALGKTLGTVTLFAVAAAQASALTARSRERDPASVRRLYAGSCGTALLAALGGAALLWAQPNDGLYPRLLGALVVLDLLLVALQPILARARPGGGAHRLRVADDAGEIFVVTIDGGDLAAAAAKAIRQVQRSGHCVVGLEVDPGPNGGGRASRSRGSVPIDKS